MFSHNIFKIQIIFKGILVLNFFYCRAPSQLDEHLTDKCCEKKTFAYDVPHSTSISDNQVYPCCGLIELEKCYAHHHSCSEVIQPFRQQLLKSETAFCDVCHKNCVSPADFVLHQEHVHFCLPLFACPVCHFTYITHSCLWMYITESHGGPKTAISILWIEFQKLYCYFITSRCKLHMIISL